MPPARVLDAFRDGMRRVAGAPLVWLGAWVTTLALAAPLALVLRDMIGAHLGSSLAAQTAASGVNWEWWQEFRAQATGLGTTFTPAVLGFAAVLGNLSDLADNVELPTVIAGAIGAWLVVWSFLAGGVLDRFARNRAVGTAAFFAACGTHFWRMLRLGALAWGLYAALFAWLHPALFDDGLYGWLTRDVDAERQAFVVRALLYAFFFLLLTAVNLTIDYARVRIVVEDRRSAVFALTAGARFVRRHLRGVAGLYALNTAVFFAVVLLYAVVAPGVGGADWTMWLALLVGQAYIALRLGVKLGFYATQVAYFQRALAHADYVAGPVPEWPESPAAEAIRGEPAASPTEP
jgi:hypothetical protein